MVRLCCVWLRSLFVVDESRLRIRLYLHRGLDLEAAERFWSEVTGIPRAQFRQPYRAEPDQSIRTVNHERGCVYVVYSCSKTHREIVGLARALLSAGVNPG
jgi:hypothetical protein